ncbi:MAG TPA: NAD(+)/NADH kinase [Treponemataceae bacterium]|nr:NAD(+)/NADH kinase [Treponemataceae bacterium]
MKKCLIVSNTDKKKSLSLATEIQLFLKDCNIRVSVVEFCGINKPLCLDKIDFIITLGGDGTVLYAARKCSKYDIPVFPVNLGEFGFIAGIQPDCWEKRLRNFLEGKEILTRRALLNGSISRADQTLISYEAMNDIVISSRDVARIVSLNVKAGAICFGQFKADGIIVCTPTGSTAYSAAAGGPIVDPRLDALILNPLSAFSLSNRPLVLPPEEILSIIVLPSRSTEVVVSWDGQEHYNVEAGDIITIKKSSQSIRLAGCGIDTFYTALRSKLHWSGGPHA